MNTGLISVESLTFKKYNALIQRRDTLRKKAWIYDRAFTQKFGELIIKVFEKKIDCIRKKKTIEYCQRILNHGGVVDQAELQKYLEHEMTKLNSQLEWLIEDYESAKKSKKISEKELLEIKRIYRRIAKQIHPDMNWFVSGNEKLMDLWNKVVVAYNCNNLKELQELEALLTCVINEDGVFPPGMDMKGIEERITEVETEIAYIENTDPYLYGDILNDPDKIKEKKEDLQTELKEYIDYEAELDVVLQQTMRSGVSMVWQMRL